MRLTLLNVLGGGERAPVERIEQSGWQTFVCPVCQT
jgi:hypothetical protein